MKRIFFCLLFAASVFAASSCVKDNFPQGHYLTKIKKVDHIVANMVTDGKTDQVSIDLYGRTATLSELNEIWSSYGDANYSRSNTDESAKLIDCRFTSIAIIALDDYDAGHPENSSLNDLFSFRSVRSRTPEWILNRYKGNDSQKFEEVKGRITDLKWQDASMFVADYGQSLTLISDTRPVAPCRVRIVLTDLAGMHYTTETVMQ